MRCGDCRWFQELPISSDGVTGLCALYTAANVSNAIAYDPDEYSFASWAFAWENRDWCRVWEPRGERR